MEYPNLFHDIRVKVTLVARPLLIPVAQSRADAIMMYSRVEHVFILKHYFLSKLFTAFREAFSVS
jgi:hypothetical protein